MNIESMWTGELYGPIRSGSGGLGWAAAADNRALTRSPISLNHTHRCREELVGEILTKECGIIRYDLVRYGAVSNSVSRLRNGSTV